MKAFEYAISQTLTEAKLFQTVGIYERTERSLKEQKRNLLNVRRCFASEKYLLCQM